MTSTKTWANLEAFTGPSVPEGQFCYDLRTDDRTVLSASVELVYRVLCENGDWDRNVVLKLIELSHMLPGKTVALAIW